MKNGDQGSRKESRMSESGKEKANSRKMLDFPIIKDCLRTNHDYFNCKYDWFEAVKKAKIWNQRVARTNTTSCFNDYPSTSEIVSKLERITDLPGLQSISMSFGYWESYFSDDVCSSLCNSLRKLHQLRNIEIYFEREGIITDIAMINLSVILRSLPRLQSLSIKFDKYEKKIDKGFIHLGKCLHYLKSIIISFPRESGIGIVSLCRSLKKNVQLQNLELCFNGVELINEALTSLSSSLKRLSALQTLSLEFERTCPSYETIQSLSESLGYLKSLRTLRLHVGDNAETNQRFIVLCQGLKNLNLQKIYLKPDSFQIKDITLEFLSEALIYQTSLQDITLPIMKGQEITNEGVEYLAEAIGNLVFLPTISLEFFRCTNVSDDGLKSLSINLACLTLLQRFYLTFRSCGVTSEGVRYLSVCLRRLTGLKSIYLAFEYCDGITDDAIEFLNGVFRHSPSLKYLSLGLNGCQITDKGANSLGDGLSSLTKLKRFNLNLVDCKKVTSEEKEKMKKKLKKLRQLKSYVKFTESSFYNYDPL